MTEEVCARRFTFLLTHDWSLRRRGGEDEERTGEGWRGWTDVMVSQIHNTPPQLELSACKRKGMCVCVD